MLNASTLGGGGGLSITADNDVNANTLPPFRVFSYATDNAIARAKNFPNGAGCIIFISVGNGCGFQVCTPTNGSTLYLRCIWGNNWSDWYSYTGTVHT